MRYDFLRTKGGKFRGRASALRVPLAHLKPAILTGAYHARHLRECASDPNDSAHAEKKRERNLYQKVTRVVIFAISFRYGS